MSEWQRIETAPKVEYQSVLGCNYRSTIDHEIRTMHWDERAGRNGRWIRDSPYNNHGKDSWEPTHWMPLPPPPDPQETTQP